GGEGRGEGGGKESSGGQGANAGLDLALLLLLQPALASQDRGALGQVERLHEAEVEDRAEGGITHLHEPLEVELALGHDLEVSPVRYVLPQAARLDVWTDVHRKELLALRVTDDGLEGPEYLQITLSRRHHGTQGRGRRSDGDARRRPPGCRAASARRRPPRRRPACRRTRRYRRNSGGVGA